MKKSQLAVLSSLTLAGAIGITACGSTTSSGGGTSSTTETITVETNQVAAQATLLQNMTNEFMKENPNIKVQFSAPGANYENQMKVKMASNSMPDVFSTHGWAKARYGNYLADLRSESWATQINKNIKPQVTDDSGKVYVLPLDQDQAGIVFNADVLSKYGVTPPKTWAEFLAACETIKTKSGGQVTPIHLGGADSWPVGQFFDYAATVAYISPQNNDASKLTDGTFDWNKWDTVAQMYLDLFKKGYLNKDVLTSTFEDSAKALAQGKAAFEFYPSAVIDEAKKVNPSFNPGLMPIPALNASDQPVFNGGEKTTWGVWKDSKHLDAAKKYVAFFAKPENIKKMAESDQLPAGLDGVTPDLGALTKYTDQYKDVQTIPYFDRQYLPNGMWDVMCKDGQSLLGGQITVQQFSQDMQKNYQRLRTQK